MQAAVRAMPRDSAWSSLKSGGPACAQKHNRRRRTLERFRKAESLPALSTRDKNIRLFYRTFDCCAAGIRWPTAGFWCVNWNFWTARPKTRARKSVQLVDFAACCSGCIAKPSPREGKLIHHVWYLRAANLGKERLSAGTHPRDYSPLATLLRSL